MDELTPDSAQTRRLLERIEAGDRGAFEQLLAEHRPDLHQFVVLRLGTRLRARVDPSDVVQETQLEVFRRLADFLRRQPMPFHLWLRRTAYQQLLTLRRRHAVAGQRAIGREVALPERSSLALARQLLAAGSTPSDQLSRREQIRRVQSALGQLPDGDREVLVMRTFEGLSYREIGCLLDIESAAARKRHGRALIRLHQLLGDGGPKEEKP
jgi:RNA polymerase sigma-70 factor (ECF subfamily)